MVGALATVGAVMVAGPHRLVSPLTREAMEELGLEVGMEATARVKSTNVRIDRV